MTLASDFRFAERLGREENNATINGDRFIFSIELGQVFQKINLSLFR